MRHVFWNYRKLRFTSQVSSSKAVEGCFPTRKLDLPEFPSFAKRMGAVLLDYARPACTGPISYRGKADLERDIANLQAAVEGVNVTEVFMTAASPGVISLFLANQYYPTHEAYLYALADAMKEEYHAIYQAGFLLQLDCPDLAVGMPGANQADVPFLDLHLQALNHAVRDIPPDRLRLHLCCWSATASRCHRAFSATSPTANSASRVY